MKKYLPYLVVIIVLAVAAGWFIKNQSKGTINEREGNFAVKDEKEIAKIILTDTEKKRVELTNANGIWMVNGKYAAREDLVKQLFESITRVQSLCPVPTTAHDNVIRDMLTHHNKVEIFDANNKLLKSYWVGGPTVDGQNTYMLLEEDGQPASRPHMTYLPGLKGYLTFRYAPDEENWRTKVLFNYGEGEIKALSVEYPGNEKNSFTLTQVAKDSFLLSPIDEKYRVNDTYQQRFVKQYLDFYSAIYIEAFDNNYSAKDSVMKTTPYCIFTVTESDNSVNKVKLFYMPLSKRSKSQFDEKGNERTMDMDHYYASIHDDKDFTIVQYYVFGKLLRNYNDFFFKTKN
ncbi:MAG: hypothetical protein KA149_00650 [Chitinophagales bacterium]|nr:hypothetical protein [Chitinophagales bacterium]